MSFFSMFGYLATCLPKTFESSPGEGSESFLSRLFSGPTGSIGPTGYTDIEENEDNKEIVVNDVSCDVGPTRVQMAEDDWKVTYVSKSKGYTGSTRHDFHDIVQVSYDSTMNGREFWDSYLDAEKTKDRKATNGRLAIHKTTYIEPSSSYITPLSSYNLTKPMDGWKTTFVTASQAATGGIDGDDYVAFDTSMTTNEFWLAYLNAAGRGDKVSDSGKLKILPKPKNGGGPPPPNLPNHYYGLIGVQGLTGPHGA